MLSGVIKSQVKEQNKEDIEELILDDWKGAELSQSDKALLESFPNLQFLSMNNCGLRSLNNFPSLPKLIKLELNDNKISGGLEKLAEMKELMQINLAGNQLRTLEDISPLVRHSQAQLSGLVVVDMYRCPVASVPQYRDSLFDRLSQLEILDGTDKNGQEASLSDELDGEEEEDYDEELEQKVRQGFIEDDEEGDEDDVDSEESGDHSEEEPSPEKRQKS